jgi:L-alanine-DL-glutamate epimerase-like enolase superfamily enzyme
MLTNLYHKTPDAMAAACRECVEEGFKGLKVKVGDTVLAKGWDRGNLLSELAILRAALDVVPPDVYIDADANQGWRSAQWTVALLMRFAAR